MTPINSIKEVLGIQEIKNIEEIKPDLAEKFIKEENLGNIIDQFSLRSEENKVIDEEIEILQKQIDVLGIINNIIIFISHLIYFFHAISPKSICLLILESVKQHHNEQNNVPIDEGSVEDSDSVEEIDDIGVSLNQSKLQLQGRYHLSGGGGIKTFFGFGFFLSFWKG